MTDRRFLQVDVFGSRPMQGNPLAVVVDATGLTDAQMQHVARWANLSETAFLLPPQHPDADYRVRIFTLSRELDFAGHPTLGSAHAWLATRPDHGRDTVVQQCGVGLVEVRREPRLAFAAPDLVRSGPVSPADTRIVLDVLGLRTTDVVDLAWADNGPGWVAVLLRDAAAVLDVTPDLTAVRPLSTGSLDVGLVGPHPGGGPADLEVRALFTDDTGGLREDPVTGSLNASVAQWLLATGRVDAPFTARQGTRLGRDGRVHVDAHGGRVWVGGTTVTVVDGTIDL